MSSLFESGGLKFVWKIENFSCLECDGFFSPLIEPQKEKWMISITRGNSNIFAYLHNWNCSTTNSVCCSFSFLNYDGTPLICKEGEIKTYETFEYVKDLFIFPNEINFFPNDTLRVEFRLWLGREHGLFSPVSRFACTRIEPIVRVIEKTFRCIVLQVRNSEKSLSASFKKIICNGPDLEINIDLRHFGQVSVEFKSMLFGFQAKIRAGVLDALGKELEFGNHNAKFTSKNTACKFNLNISKAILLCYSNKFLPSEKLSLIFTCKFSGCFNSNRIVDEREIFEIRPRTDSVTNADSDEPETRQANKTPALNTDQPKSRCTISETVQDLFSEGYFSDFNLKVGDRTFPVHKAILGMRSKVFRAMFDSEMKEMQDNCVDIKDVDGDTLQRMLQFIYSDRLDKNMDWKEASSLYTAADFYALEPLKQGCSTILKEGLSVTSTLGVLAFADLHQDRQLKSAALEYISLNDQDIIGTEDWNKFEEENTKLAFETFRDLYLKKMKG